MKGLCQSSSDFECDARCYGCADSNNGRACYDCADSSFLKEPSDDIGLFSCKCRSGFFFDGSICDLCEDPCVECGESSTDCKVCDKAFKRVLENGTCECMEGFEDLGSGCVPTNYHNTGTACTNEEFWEESTESCKPCSLNCWSCEEKADSCLTCRYGFQ